MPIENCGCGGSQLDRFYSLFVCDRANCKECKWTNNKCCLGVNDENIDIGDCTNNCCINYYNIPMHDVVTPKIKSFGFCKTNVNAETGETFGALAIQFVDGTKKLYTNINKEVYDGLKNANKDYLYINLSQSTCDDNIQCISIA